MAIFVGLDWAEDHHDIEVRDDSGKRLARVRLDHSIEGVARFHAIVAEFVEDPSEVIVATETDRGLFIAALVDANYQVYAVNPLSLARYRQRHVTSGAKSDPGDAFELAELARTDRHNHRRVAGDSDRAEAIKVLARAHQNLIWAKQRHTNQLRSNLLEYYPAALAAFDDLGDRDAIAVLKVAPTPARGRQLSRSKIRAALERGGRQRGLDAITAEIQAELRRDHLVATELVAEAMGATTAALVAVIAELSSQIAGLEEQLDTNFDAHPDAKIVRSLPGLATVLGARVLGEFGDDPNRYADAKSRKNYAGTSPITRASGKTKVVMARYARNGRLSDACYLWAFASLSKSPGARAFYDHHKAIHNDHDEALRALANRLVGLLHGCLRHSTTYDEHLAWAHRNDTAA